MDRATWLGVVLGLALTGLVFGLCALEEPGGGAWRSHLALGDIAHSLSFYPLPAQDPDDAAAVEPAHGPDGAGPNGAAADEHAQDGHTSTGGAPNEGAPTPGDDATSSSQAPVGSLVASAKPVAPAAAPSEPEARAPPADKDASDTEAAEEEEPPKPTHGALAGWVRDEAGAGLQGAWVDARRKKDRVRAESAADGSFELGPLKPGKWKVSVGHAGYITAKPITVTVEAGKTHQLPQFFLAVGQTLSGLVIDESSGDPLPGVRVELRPDGRRRGNRQTVTSDEEGWFEASGLFEGLWHLSASLHGHLGATRVVRIEATPPQPIEVTMPSGAWLTGTILGPDGEPFPLARVFLLVGDDYKVREQCDTAGVFTTKTLPPGDYSFFARADDFSQLHTTNLRLELGANQQIFQLLPDGQVAGRVLDSSGEPVRKIHVRLESLRGQVIREAETQDDGTFEIGRLYDDDFRLWAYGDGFLPSPQAEIQIRNQNQVGGITLSVSRGARVQGTVFASGSAADKARVSLYPHGDNPDTERLLWTSRETKSDGGYRFEGLPPGDYELWATSRDRLEQLRQAVRVDGVQELAIDLHLQPELKLPGSLSGQLQDIPEAYQVEAVQLPHGGGPRKVRVLQDGSFELTSLSSGLYRVRLLGPGLDDARRPSVDLDLRPGHLMRADFRLEE